MLGQGTWGMGESPAAAAAEVAALRRGLELGLTLIDTAEMYGEGGAEEVVGEAIARPARRGLPGQQGLPAQRVGRGARSPPASAACGGCGTDRIDLYLLHWRGAHPLAETVAAFERLRRDGQDPALGREQSRRRRDGGACRPCPAGSACATDQVLYNPSRRGIEWDLLPWCRERGMPVMAYSPIEQGRLPTGGALGEIGASRGCGPFQVALAWVLAQPGVIAIPKASAARACRGQRARPSSRR